MENGLTESPENPNSEPLSKIDHPRRLVSGSAHMTDSAVSLLANTLALPPLKLFRALQWSVCSCVRNIASMSRGDSPKGFKYASTLRMPTPASMRMFAPRKRRNAQFPALDVSIIWKNMDVYYGAGFFFSISFSMIFSLRCLRSAAESL